MSQFPPTLILRHRKENLKKCSLTPLQHRKDFRFYTYPWNETFPSLEHYVVLSIGAPPLTCQDRDKGIFLIDATWRYAEKMEKTLPHPHEKRSIPPICKTAYPRKQTGCLDEAQGLASVEALYVAYLILGRDPKALLDGYRFAADFLASINSNEIGLFQVCSVASHSKM